MSDRISFASHGCGCNSWSNEKGSGKMVCETHQELARLTAANAALQAERDQLESARQFATDFIKDLRLNRDKAEAARDSALATVETLTGERDAAERKIGELALRLAMYETAPLRDKELAGESVPQGLHEMRVK